MEYQNKKLNCKDCNQEFVWSAGEQKFFADKGFNSPPVRCSDCRKKKKDRVKDDNSSQTNNDELFQIKCSKCGKVSEVPFKPRESDNLLCSDCFDKSIAEKSN